MTAQLLPEGTITTPGGFRATGIHAGLKTTRDRDLGLLIAKSACSAAAHFGAGSKIAGAWTTANLRRGAEDIRTPPPAQDFPGSPAVDETVREPGMQTRELQVEQGRLRSLDQRAARRGQHGGKHERGHQGA